MSRSLYSYLALIASFAFIFNAPVAFAHKASDAYLQVSEPSGVDLPRSSQGAFELKFSIALRDVDANVEALDQDNDRELSWLEVRSAMPLIESWVQAGFKIVCADTKKALRWSFDGLEQKSDGAYVRLRAVDVCAAKGNLAIQYELMKEIDSAHRLLVTGTLAGGAIATVIAPQAAALTLVSGLESSASQQGSQNGSTPRGLATFKRFFSEGFWHLSLGFDHLLFLLALVLPVTLSRSSLIGLLGTITTFTIGHSITLGLATFGWVASPVWVEPAITLSIAVTALLNLVGASTLEHEQHKLSSRLGALLRVSLNTRWVALVFGLIHGLGFSGVMTEAGVDRSLLLWALGGFNLGLEAAQLFAVVAWLSLCFGFFHWSKFKLEYWLTMVRGGSVALLLVALVWTAQRLL